MHKRQHALYSSKDVLLFDFRDYVKYDQIRENNLRREKTSQSMARQSF